MKPINITTLGGGTGTFNVLFGLKQNQNLNLAAIVNVSDSGGSTGDLRDEFGVLPPGDARRALVALSEDTGIIRKLFEYRFKRESSLSGHTIGNLLLTALSDITGSFESGIQELSEMFHVRGKVIPVSLDNIQLGVILEDGQRIIGETHIDIPKHNPSLTIKEAFLIGGGKANPNAIDAIMFADYIIIAPGDLYTSIVPNLLVQGIPEALQTSTAKVIYICNIMTKHGETDNFSVEDFVTVIESYIGKGRINYVAVNSGEISSSLREKYQNEENKQLVQLKYPFQNTSYKVIQRDLVNEQDFIRHDPKKVARLVEDFVNGWVK